MTLCDREGDGVWSMRIYAWAKIISTVLLALVLYLLRLVVWFCFFLSVDYADSVGFLAFFVIHSFIHYMFVDFIVYYFILDVTISHIITVKSVVIRKPSFFEGGFGQV